jgi:hypothetical protein
VVSCYRKIEDVESTLDQIRDQVEDHEEVSLAMSEGIGQDAFLDEGELEDELANLEMEVRCGARDCRYVANRRRKRDWTNK